MTPDLKFDAVVDLLIDKYKDCRVGKMMSAPGLQYKKKNFAFYHKETMGFKLGKDYDITAHGVKNWNYLSPFKTKPPMCAWYVLEKDEMEHWAPLAELAYKKLKNDLG